MNAPLLASRADGTWRLRDPAQTLEWITPRLAACGITRCADVTHLDPIGLPVHCAIRPTAAVLQVSNGKGLTQAAAQVSALMEGVEFFHAENPAPGVLERWSTQELQARSEPFLAPAELHGFHANAYCNERLRLEWAWAEDLLGGPRMRVPASALFFHRTPSLHRTSTNGLASGNHTQEATLHALFELIERDAAARLQVGGRVPIKGNCQVLDPASFQDEGLRWLHGRIVASESRLVLLRVPSRIPSVHTFWAVLLNEHAWISGTSFNTGWGTHVDAAVAAGRAVTEAVQSRVTMVHGAREDALAKPVFRHASEIWTSKAFQFFRTLEPDTRWDALPEAGRVEHIDLDTTLQGLLRELAAAGVSRVLRADLSRAEIGVPVVRVIAPDLALRTA
jgi:YcaO-like protein with predicted kinase domain